MQPIVKKSFVLEWIEVYENKVELGRKLTFTKTSIPIKQIANVQTSTSENGDQKFNAMNMGMRWILIESTGGKTHKVKLRKADAEVVAEKILELIN